jgi:cytochrome c553
LTLPSFAVIRPANAEPTVRASALRVRSSLAVCCAALAVVISAGAERADAQQAGGAAIYRDLCARCHGKAGEGVKAHYPKALTGNRTLEQLTRYIERTMPEDDPKKCVGPDAVKVAAYIFDAFYSPAAQARNKTPRVELARLTVSEYQNALADLVGTFRPVLPTGRPGRGPSPEALPPSESPAAHGLRAQYFKSPSTPGKRNRELALSRVDPVVKFDFGPSSPDFDKLKTDDFAVTWQGSVTALDTGLYDFIVRTEHATRLWVNDFRQPLIDAWVKSGDDTEFRGSIFLLGGRAYPLRLEFQRGHVGVRKERKDLPQVKTTIELAWKPPHRAADVIPERHLLPTDSGTAFSLTTPLPPDDRSAGYERGTAVSKAWVQATVDGAIETANYVAANLAELAGVRADAPERKEKLQEFCVKFVQRAFRRPLTPEQKKLYIDGQFEAVKDPQVAVKRVVLLALQSPRFLYREPAANSTDGGDAFDVAARLSFGLWDSLPDEELVNAAREGRLKTRGDVVRQAERMLADRRARTKLRGFLLRWLQADQVHEIAKDPKLYPGFDANVVADLQTSLELLLDDIVWSDNSDFRQLLLADRLHLNGRLAKLYGADLPPDAPFQKVALKSSERAGVLTHPFLLASFSYTATTSPIHRGVFLARNVLGVALRQPPDAFTPLAPDLHPKLNTRERTVLQTSPKACMSCHGVINPLGFTLEGFDAIGRPRGAEKDRPVDTSGFYVTRGGDVVNFKGPRDLAAFLTRSEEVHEAFTARLFHHYVRQPILAYGPDKLDELRRFFADNGYNVRRLLVEIIARTATAE